MKEKIVIFTGAGISAESGLRTFRNSDGYWNEYPIEQVATPEGWHADPELVLNFYNTRRREVLSAQPNAAHLALVRLEERFDVTIVTQNIDDLHERAGSSRVIHVHGEVLKAQSSHNPDLVYPLHKPTIEMGELCELGSQLRPNVVWFGEAVLHLDQSAECFAQASRVLTVGTSLAVYPAAGLVQLAPRHARKYLVSPDADQTVPAGNILLCGTATEVVPHVVDCWLTGREPDEDGFRQNRTQPQAPAQNAQKR